jgi:dihydrofolate synthase/folylpolyglutamate synthase
MKPGRPVATGRQVEEVSRALRDCAAAAGATLLERGRDWEIRAASAGVEYEDRHGALALPLPGLAGPHQLDNAGIAIAALRASSLGYADADYAGIKDAAWPGRLQRLTGALASGLPDGFELWLDGGHNAGAGEALAGQLEAWSDRPLYLLVGMKQGKDSAGFLRPMLAHATSVWAVAEPSQHLASPVEAIVEASGGVARIGPDIVGALRQVADLSPGRVLICGSLYLAGEVLKKDGGPRPPRRS